MSVEARGSGMSTSEAKTSGAGVSTSEAKTSEEIDIRLLVRWLGTQGAKAGLLMSKTCTSEILHHISKNLGLEVEKGAARQRMVDDIIRVASRRIDKSIDELYSMSQPELVDYFERVGATADELLEMLQKLDLNPRNKESRRNLIEFAAREFSETGRFMRIASGGGKKADNGHS
jgi:hypothetical protein